MTNTGVLQTERLRTAVARIGRGIGFVLTVLVGLLTGFGLLYLLHDAGWLPVGPSVGDSLPLLQLAGLDGQPVLWLILAWVLAGALTGSALTGFTPSRRALLAGTIALLLLLLASQAADALARNLRFGWVLQHRTPGWGPWLEALLFAIGCALPRRPLLIRRRPAWRGLAVRGRRGIGDLGLSGGKLGHAGQHERDRPQMDDDRDRIGAQ